MADYQWGNLEEVSSFNTCHLYLQVSDDRNVKFSTNEIKGFLKINQSQSGFYSLHMSETAGEPQSYAAQV